MQFSTSSLLLCHYLGVRNLPGKITPPCSIGKGNYPINYGWGSRAPLGGRNLGRTHLPRLQDMPRIRGRAA